MGCVYVATHRDSGRRYVGATLTTLSLRRRAHKWCVNTGRSQCPRFHRALRKYGLDSFDWEVLFEGDDPAILFRVERDFILEFNCIAPLGFNMTGGGDGVWNPSQETRQKMRESARRRPPPSEATREKRRQSQKASGRRPPPPVVGHSVSEESRRKISAALKGHPVSEETIEKIRKTQQARKEAGYVRKKRKPATAETRAKISAQRKGKTYEEIYGPEKAREKRLAITKKMIGRVITEEHRRRISETKQRKKNAS